jgi:YVTN family beta-propeller protein
MHVKENRIMSRRAIHWIALLLVTPLWAQQAAMAVVEKKAGMVAFYTADGKRLSAVKVGLYPHEMAFSPDRRLLYVSDNGVEWMTDTGKGDNTLSVIDVATLKKVGVIDLGNYYRPHGMLVLPKTGHLVVTIENPDGLLLIDPAAKKVLRKYDTSGQHPHMVMLGPNAETAWASNANNGEVAVVNLASGKVEKTIPTGKNPQGAVITKDGKWVFLTNTASNTISVIDAVKRAVVGEIKTSDGPARIVLTPDEKTLVYNLLTGSAVGFADIQSRKETTVVNLPGRPLSLSTSQDGKTAYLGIQDSDKIAIVAVPERKIIRIIDTPKGAGPDTVAPLG